MVLWKAATSFAGGKNANLEVRNANSQAFLRPPELDYLGTETKKYGFLQVLQGNLIDRYVPKSSWEKKWNEKLYCDTETLSPCMQRFFKSFMESMCHESTT